MRAFARSNIGYYPSAALVFVPSIPNGSSAYAGDFKVSVLGMDRLEDEINKKQTGCWSLDQWRAFARHHHLIPISTVAAAFAPMLLKAERLVARYACAYSQMYGPGSADLIQYTCTSDGNTLTSEEIARQVFDAGADILLRGPSGCGKSLLAAHAGMALLQRGGVPVTIPTKDFQGNLKSVLDREAGLLAAPSAAALLGAARKLNRPTLFILDGYNECRDGERAQLTRSVAALSRRYESGILVTSQIPLARADLLPLREIEVPVPDRSVKLSIAMNASAGQALPPGAEVLLDSVASGLEAGLVGEVGCEINTGASRYSLFDAFARKRLGGLASDGIRALLLIAGWTLPVTVGKRKIRTGKP